MFKKLQKPIKKTVEQVESNFAERQKEETARKKVNVDIPLDDEPVQI